MRIVSASPPARSFASVSFTVVPSFQKNAGHADDDLLFHDRLRSESHPRRRVAPYAPMRIEALCR